MNDSNFDAPAKSPFNADESAGELSAAYTVSVHTLPAPEPMSFGRYEGRGLRGRGGFAAVYAGYDSLLQREVAIKVPFVRLEERDADVFLREARNLAKLSHRGILTVFDVGMQDGQCFIVSDLLQGDPLDRWLKTNTPHWREVAEIGAAVAEALSHAHERAVVHRDVKPGNVILTADRGPVLVDFGLAITDQAHASELGRRSGTPSFMSPEQIEGRAHRIDGRTDIYSLGVMLYQMFCRRLPFRAPSIPELVRQIRDDDPQPPRQLVPNLPTELERVCLTAMAKSPGDRYTTAGDMARALRDFLHGTAVATKRPERRAEAVADTPAPRVQRRHLSFLALTWEALDRDAEPDADDQAERNATFKRRCSEIASRYSGTILYADSNSMQVCFGYPVAQEDATRRAVHAGIDIRDLLRATTRPHRHDVMQCWIAVHTGTVVVRQTDSGAPDVTGDPVTLVKRLDSVTEPGELFVTRDVWRLVSRYFETSDAGSHRIRGAREPVELFRVGGAAAGVRTVEAGMALTPLIGRDQEKGLLFDRWNQTREGMGQAVMLAGDAGLGKSRLLHVLKDHVSVEVDPPIVEWRCSPYHSHSALHPAIDYWTRTLGFVPGEPPKDQLERLKQYLRGFEMELAASVPLIGSLMGLPEDDEFPARPLTAQRQKDLTIELITAWLAAKAAKTPLLFLVEDLHWIDPTTLDLLVSLVDEPLPEPIMCVFTFRPEFTVPWTSRRVTQIALNRLTRTQIGEMIRSRASVDKLPATFIERVVERTDGVPLFVEEMTNALVESGRIGEVAARGDEGSSSHHDSVSWSRLAVPESLQDLLMARLDRLGGNNVVVQVAAAIGREFSPDLLSAACDLPESEMNTELERLVRAEVVYRHGRAPNVSYIFKHALIQDAAYESMVKKERARVHGKIAGSLATLFPDVVAKEPETQAYHLTEAGLVEEAIEYWSAAGERAVQRSNFPEALAHLTRGMELLKQLPESPARDAKEYRLNVPLGIASLSLRGYASPELGDLYERRYQLCDRMGDDMGRLHAIWASASWRIVRSEQDVAKTLAERILALAAQMGDDGARMEALFIAQIVAFYRGELEDALRYGTAAMDLYQPERCMWHTARLGQHAGVATLSYLALTQWHLGASDAAFASMTRAVDMAYALNHPFSVAFVLYHSALLNKACRLGNETQRAGETQIAVAREAAFSFWEATGHLYRAGGLVEQGRYDEAREQLVAGLPRFEAHGARLGLPFYRSYLAEAYLELGDLDQARSTIDSAQSAIEASNERFHEPEVIRLRGVLAMRGGDDAGALEQLERSIALARSQAARAWELRSTTMLAELLARSGQSAAARERLAAVYGRFDQGFDTPDLVRARALIQELG